MRNVNADKERKIQNYVSAFDQIKKSLVRQKKFFHGECSRNDSELMSQNVTIELSTFGVYGIDLRSNVLNVWREFFVSAEEMLEIDISKLGLKSIRNGVTLKFQSEHVQKLKILEQLFDGNEKHLPLAMAAIRKTSAKYWTYYFSHPRERTVAEIFHFRDSHVMDHPKFKDIGDQEFTFYSYENQFNDESADLFTIQEAIKNNLISSETMGYFTNRIQLFLVEIGIDPEFLRFYEDEDEWIVECYTSCGWTQCVICTEPWSTRFEEIGVECINLSFDIDNIVCALLEHSFRTRSIEENSIFSSLPIAVAPKKFSVFPFSEDKKFDPIVKQTCELLILKLHIF